MILFMELTAEKNVAPTVTNRCALYHIENSTSLSTVVAMSRMNENQMVWKYNKW